MSTIKPWTITQIYAFTSAAQSSPPNCGSGAGLYLSHLF
jgi:hypothetical protein